MMVIMGILRLSFRLSLTLKIEINGNNSISLSVFLGRYENICE